MLKKTHSIFAQCFIFKNKSTYTTYSLQTKHYATDSSVFDDFLALPCIRNIVVLDNAGSRIVAKYYSNEKDPKAFEKELWNKCKNRNATDTDLIVLEGENSF